MRTVEPTESVRSPRWVTTCPDVTVVIATHNRAAYLPELVDALERQRHAPPFEVVIADDGSTDETWTVLTTLARSTELPFLALRLPPSGGPSVPRNTAVAACHGDLIAFTDDDCLPHREWLARLLPAVHAGRVVQGRTKPMRDGQVSPWDRTISITAETGLWESCNLAVPRRVFQKAGGFPVLDLLGEGGRGFGEDTVLGSNAARIAGGFWAPTAIVRHRWVRGDYRSHLEAMRRHEAMPELVRLVPELRDYCYHRWFRSRRAAAFDVALLAVASAAAVRRVEPLVAAAPWMVLITRAARTRWGRNLAVRIAQEATADAAGLGAQVKGSLQARTLLL
ncbi:MAG: glycosyltransferase family 2 protein [Frankiaceae bacterium]|nr:glycosyltransferase family 2 protein [Frankiaceae bacterium]MBV9871469.1 glycosyltransferase family 2 protein [Frankiaceae bacterium]